VGKHLDKDQTLKLAEFTIEHSGDSIIFHDCHGYILKANQSACKLLNYSAKDLVGLSIKDINPDSNKSQWKKFWKELQSSKTISFEARHKTRDGKIIPTDVTVNYLEFDNQEYAVGFVRNISCRKKIEEERAAAYEEICRLRGKLELEKDYLYEEVKELQSFGNIIGKSFSLQTILKQIEMVATTDANVLITGESGTGKELFAHEIHQRSPRSAQPMIRVNCASIPRELYESEFFGHVKGAFTGAIKDRVGRFQLADGGTLFLDEVGEIPLDLQSKLLRVLQEGTFERVGDEKTYNSDVRIIAATNRNLKKDVAKGTFREDLYYRLNVFPIEAPPLRERREDIPLLVGHFLEIAQDKFNRTGIKLSKANLISLESYDWPGNIRELQNIIERAVIISQSGRLNIDLPKGTQNRNTSLSNQYIKPTEKVLTFEEVKLFERGNILKALDSSNWKIFGADGAAALLDIPPTTLTTRIKRLGLKKPSNP
jgi:PAS domain S-box-containing protein